MERTEALLLYRRRDQIEKIFDALKNELQNGRLRVHSREAMEGWFFLSFLSLILYSVPLAPTVGERLAGEMVGA